ncbi:MAG: PQQ-binding-like beta-propeller repeat protein [Gammaproteobacteria bacterium]
MRQLVQFFLLSVLLTATARPLAQDGEALYQQFCSSCHDNPIDRAPNRAALTDYNANAVYHAMAVGIMRPQAATLTDEQRIILAEHLSGGSYNRDLQESFRACAEPIGELDLAAAGNWNGWGGGPSNAQYQPSTATRISKSNIDQLQLAWAIGIEGASASRAQAAVIDGVLFKGSPSGQVYALDLESGCQYWTYAAIAEVRAAPSVVYAEALGETLVIVADQSNRVYALDAQTGLKRWHSDPDPNPWAISTGAPAVYGDQVLVPVSSMEVAGAGNPQHECCSFRGNVAALNLTTGDILWHSYIMDEPAVVGQNSIGNNILAPSGAPIWDSPTIDPERNRLYVGTGQNYSRPTSGTSDAVIAFNLDSGNMDWVFQSTANDAFTLACSGRSEHPNCPDPGPDVDIGASPLLVTLSDGRDIVVAGTKGSMVYGLDPDNGGEVLWSTRVGRGSPLGGVHWGMGYQGDTLYVPISDRIPGGSADPQPGLHAIDMNTGAVLWYAPAPNRCEGAGFSCANAYSAAPLVLDDLVLVGALNGVLFAHDRDSGAVVWELDTRQSYETVNNVAASGGAIDATAPIAVGDYLILHSGYATFGQLAGNVMLVLKLSD